MKKPPKKAEDSTTAVVLRAIKAFWDREGFSPSIWDIMVATGISSTSVVKYHMLKLERAGVVKRTPRVVRSCVLLTEREQFDGLL